MLIWSHCTLTYGMERYGLPLLFLSDPRTRMILMPVPDCLHKVHREQSQEETFLL